MTKTEMSTKLLKEMGISDEVYAYSNQILDGLKDRFEEIDTVCEYNQLKVLKALPMSL